MGLKKFFKIKPPEEATPDENRMNLQELGITTKQHKNKRDKFSAYGKFARDKTNDKFYAPEGYEQYARSGMESTDDLNNSPMDSDPNMQNNVLQQNADQYALHSQPYSANGGGNSYNSDPYAVNRNQQNDPYQRNTQNMNDIYRANVNNDYNYESDPYTKFQNKNTANSYLNDYEHLTSKPKTKPYYLVPDIVGGANVGAVSGVGTSAAVDYNNIRNNMNSYSTPNSSTGDVQNKSISSINHSQTSMANGRSNPYSGYSTNAVTSGRIKVAPGSNPYGSMQSDSYASMSNDRLANPYSKRNNSPSNLARTTTGITMDLNRTDSNRLCGQNDQNMFNNQVEYSEQENGQFDFEEGSRNELNEYNNNSQIPVDELDLNATVTNNQQIDDFNATRQEQLQAGPQTQQGWQMEESEQNYDYDYNNEDYGNGNYGTSNQRGYKSFEEIQREEVENQQAEEEEAVDELKQEIKFTKQASVASTRNTLKMAQEAEMAGMNTLGVLGHQSEKLNSIETNLDLLKAQNKTADDKVAELKKYNRNILAVHVSNPFTSKRRNMEKESKLRNRKIEEKLTSERTNNNLYTSTQRISSALNGQNEMSSEVRERYKREEILERSKRYQFENDEEDDAIEIEIDKNLDKIQQVSGRLRKLAIAAGEEVESQQGRIKDIEENADDLDIKIHMNTLRLADIR